jgi:hypothetical protein
MRRRISGVMVMVAVSTLVMTPALFAQAKKDAESGLDRIEGIIESINKEESTVVVKQRQKAAMNWTIAFNKDTTFSYRNEKATADELQPGRRVIVLGRFEEPKSNNRLTAVRVDIRTGK